MADPNDDNVFDPNDDGEDLAAMFQLNDDDEFGGSDDGFHGRDTSEVENLVFNYDDDEDGVVDEDDDIVTIEPEDAYPPQPPSAPQTDSDSFVQVGAASSSEEKENSPRKSTPPRIDQGSDGDLGPPLPEQNEPPPPSTDLPPPATQVIEVRSQPPPATSDLPPPARPTQRSVSANIPDTSTHPFASQPQSHSRAGSAPGGNVLDLFRMGPSQGNSRRNSNEQGDGGLNDLFAIPGGNGAGSRRTNSETKVSHLAENASPDQVHKLFESFKPEPRRGSRPASDRSTNGSSPRQPIDDEFEQVSRRSGPSPAPSNPSSGRRSSGAHSLHSRNSSHVSGHSGRGLPQGGYNDRDPHVGQSVVERETSAIPPPKSDSDGSSSSVSSEDDDHDDRSSGVTQFYHAAQAWIREKQEMQEQMDFLEQQIEQGRAMLQQEQQRSAVVDANFREFQQQVQELAPRVVQLEDDNDLLTKDNEQLRNEVEVLVKQNDDLLIERAQHQAECPLMKADFDPGTQLVDASDMNKLIEDNQILRAKIEELQMTEQKTRESKEALVEELERLRTEFADREEETRTLFHEIDRLGAQINVQKDMMANLEAQRIQADQEYNALVAEYHNLFQLFEERQQEDLGMLGPAGHMRQPSQRFTRQLSKGTQELIEQAQKVHQRERSRLSLFQDAASDIFSADSELSEISKKTGGIVYVPHEGHREYFFLSTFAAKMFLCEKYGVGPEVAPPSTHLYQQAIGNNILFHHYYDFIMNELSPIFERKRRNGENLMNFVVLTDAKRRQLRGIQRTTMRDFIGGRVVPRARRGMSRQNSRQNSSQRRSARSSGSSRDEYKQDVEGGRQPGGESDRHSDHRNGGHLLSRDKRSKVRRKSSRKKKSSKKHGHKSRRSGDANDDPYNGRVSNGPDRASPRDSLQRDSLQQGISLPMSNPEFGPLPTASAMSQQPIIFSDGRNDSFLSQPVGSMPHVNIHAARGSEMSRPSMFGFTPSSQISPNTPLRASQRMSNLSGYHPAPPAGGPDLYGMPQNDLSRHGSGGNSLNSISTLNGGGMVPNLVGGLEPAQPPEHVGGYADDDVGFDDEESPILTELNLEDEMGNFR